MLVAHTNAGGPSGAGSSSPAADPSWKEIVKPVEPFLDGVARRLAVEVEAFDPAVAEYVAYALTNQGKQLRSALVALSGGVFGVAGDSHVTVAVIIEMVHLATLVHDDITDDAAMRRRQPTLTAQWGPTISVLTGDCLFANALRLAAEFPTTAICRAVAEATQEVCTGEIIQTRFAGNLELTRDQYFKILRMKTGELFALSCQLGGQVSGATLEQQCALRQFGLDLGIAYQIYDDCLDLFSTEAMTGKSLGADLAHGKLTLPVIVALERACGPDRACLSRWIQEWTPDHLTGLLGVLDRYRALEESLRIIQNYVNSARQELGGMPASLSRDALGQMAGFLARETAQLAGCLV